MEFVPWDGYTLVVVYSWYFHVIWILIIFMITSLVQKQLWYFLGDSEIILKDMGKFDWRQTTAKHNIALIMCIFLGMYST